MLCRIYLGSCRRQNPKKCDLAKTIELLRLGLELVRPLAEMPNDEQAESFIKTKAERHEVKLGDLMMPLRVAITGSRVSPPLFGSLRILGTECSQARVRRALEKLNGWLLLEKRDNLVKR